MKGQDGFVLVEARRASRRLAKQQRQRGFERERAETEAQAKEEVSRGFNKTATRGARRVFQGPRRMVNEILREMEARARLHFVNVQTRGFREKIGDDRHSRFYILQQIIGGISRSSSKCMGVLTNEI